jgi:hypothetical protein
MLGLLKALAAVLTLFSLLGVWGSLALVGFILAALVGLYAFGDRLWEMLIDRETLALGKTLEGANVAIHGVSPASEPDPSFWRTGDDEEDDAFEEALEASDIPEGDYDWYQIDLSIEPRVTDTEDPIAWDPSLVRLSKNDGKAPRPLEFDIDCLVASVEVWREGRFVLCDEVVTGPGRIRLHVGVTPGTKDVRLSFLGVLLGELSLTSRGGGRCFTPSSSAARKGAGDSTRGERVSITQEWL